MRFILLVLFSTLLLGCGPRITEMRMAFFPPRAGDCSLKFISTTMEDFRPGGPYVIVGHIGLSEEGVQNPFAEKYARIVRPRACAMGGELVTLGMSAVSQGMGSGSTTLYQVLRWKQPSSKERDRDRGKLQL